jgi:hypothetical protein
MKAWVAVLVLLGSVFMLGPERALPIPPPIKIRPVP